MLLSAARLSGTNSLSNSSRTARRRKLTLLLPLNNRTHYHLLIQLPEERGLSAGMRLLNGLYSRVTNKKYGRTGHLFHNRFYAAHIEDEEHLLTACRYIVMNPVRAGICALPSEWRWSSYRASAGLVRPPEFLAVGRLLSLFDRRRDVAVAAYRRFAGGPVSDTNTEV